MSTLHVLLPPLARFAEAPALLRWLARGNRLPDVADARDATLRSLFGLGDDALPVAALRHRAHVDDVAAGNWLCADPAYVRSEATGARLMAWPVADVTTNEAVALAAELLPFFDEAGMSLSVDAASGWCLRLPDGVAGAAFVRPQEALGADLLECLPRGDAGRPWRRLFNEAQVALHAHPVNAARKAAGKLPINALWFWGAGALPQVAVAALTQAFSDDAALRGLAKLAGIGCSESTPSIVEATACAGGALLDLDAPAPTLDVDAWLACFQRSLRNRHVDAVAPTFADGARFCVRHAHRLRWWRRG